MGAAGGADGPGEGGFALVAALGAALLFSLLAYAILAADRGDIAEVQAQLSRARMEAAADAGLATAVAGLGAPINRRWEIDRRHKTLIVDDVQVDVVVEDERGKAPLNSLRPEQARRLFQAAGVSGARLDLLTDNLLDWEDGARRPNGTKDIDYAAEDLHPRQGPFRTVDELMAVRGMDPAIFDRIAPDLTVFFGFRGVFDPTSASPLAKAVMSPAIGDPSASASIQRPTLAAPGDDYVGRPFAVRIAAHDAAGGELRRAYIVELTGQPSQPFWVRAVD